MKKTYKLCLSTNVHVEGKTLPDEEALRRLQDAFECSNDLRLNFHAEIITYHLQKLLDWALWNKDSKLPETRIDAHTDEAPSDATMNVDCFLTTGTDAKGSKR